MPDTATLAEVSSVAHTITAPRSRRVFTPMDWASSSPRVSRFIRHRSTSSGTIPRVTGMDRNSTSLSLMEDRDPISQ